MQNKERMVKKRMGKLFCPDCGSRIKRRIVLNRGETDIIEINLVFMPTMNMTSHSYDALYECSCGFRSQKYWRYVSGHDDFETEDMFIGSLAKYGFVGKSIITLFIFGAPIALLTILFGVNVGSALVVFGLLWVFGYGFPVMFIICAWADHGEDQAKLQELDSEFMYEFELGVRK